LRALLERFFGHPVMGVYTIILLVTINLCIPLVMLGHRDIAFVVSLGGQILAMLWAGLNMIWDLFR
jgi:hypothetical protein